MREIFCCGTGQRTAYCATCGKRLQAYPLSDLLNHCREQAHKAAAKLKAATVTYTTAILHKHRDDPAYLPMFRAIDVAPASCQRGTRTLTSGQQKDVTKLIAAAHQWASWAALEGIMKHVATLPPEPAPPAPGAEPADGARNLEV